MAAWVEISDDLDAPYQVVAQWLDGNYLTYEQPFLIAQGRQGIIAALQVVTTSTCDAIVLWTEHFDYVADSGASFARMIRDGGVLLSPITPIDGELSRLAMTSDSGFIAVGTAESAETRSDIIAQSYCLQMDEDPLCGDATCAGQAAGDRAVW